MAAALRGGGHVAWGARDGRRGRVGGATTVTPVADESDQAGGGGATAPATVAGTAPPGEEPEKPQKKGRRRLRTVSSWILIVLACLLALLSVVTIYAKDQLLDTDTYVSTVAPLASNPAIQNRVATVVSTELVEQTDLQQRIENALPPRASFLAAPLTAQVQTLAHALTLKYVQSDSFAKQWRQLNLAAHTQVDNLLTGSQQGALSSSNGQVTLDLGKVGAAVRAELVQRGVTVVNKIPHIKAPKLVLFKSAALVKMQRATKLLTKLAVLLPILSVLLMAAAVVAANNRRKGLVRMALALAVTAGVVLIAIGLGRNWYLSTIADQEKKEASAAAVGAFSGILVDMLRTILIVALVIGIVAWAAGTRLVREWSSRRELPAWLVSSPVHRFAVRYRRGLQWGTLAVGLVLLVAWTNPTALVAVVIVLVFLFLAGLIGLYARLPDPRAAEVTSA